MSIGEIARALFKRGWADHLEYTAALRAFGQLSALDQARVEAIGLRYL